MLLVSGLTPWGHSDGKRKLRLVKDASLDQRMRGQAYYHLKVETEKLLTEMGKWGGSLYTDNTGPRGCFFASNHDQVWELAKLEFSKHGEPGFIEPNLKSFDNFGVGEKGVQELMERVLSKLTLKPRKI